ncbi:MAG: TylF/MycF/NovP-related O-methyltransferase [Elainella sp.]
METAATTLEQPSRQASLGKPSFTASLRKRFLLLAYRISCKLYTLFSRNNYYQQAVPLALYAPWNVDQGFQRAYQRIFANTLVDQYRCFELWSLVEQVQKLDEGSIIEIGVWQGGTGVLMAHRVATCGITDPVYLCDTFSGVVKASDKDSFYKGSEHADTSQAIVEQLVSQFGLTQVKILKGIFPDETAHLIGDDKFRLCHVDVDVYQSAKDVVAWVWDRMVPGGIIVYDDYGFLGCDGITKLVEEQRALSDRLVFHNLNGHAIVVKLA